MSSWQVTPWPAEVYAHNYRRHRLRAEAVYDTPAKAVMANTQFSVSD